MIGAAAQASDFVDLAGPATGFFAVSNVKNSTTQNGIEGKDINGNFNPSHNGLPDYPNYQIPTGFSNPGVWSAIIASPQSTANDYAAFLEAFYPGESITVNNQTITQSDFSTFSSGRIDYDNALVAGLGIENVPVSALTFNFNTYAWDGDIDSAQTGYAGSNWNNPNITDLDPLFISPFSPVYTPYNDGSGLGNAGQGYLITIDNVTGNGLTFVNGQMTAMDFTGDLTVQALNLAFVDPDAPSENIFSLENAVVVTATGTLSTDDPDNPLNPLDYHFDIIDTVAGGFFAAVNVYADQAGTVEIDALPGDANFDGVVDQFDVDIVRLSYNGSGLTWAEGDFTYDGLVDIVDLNVLAANYGATSVSTGDPVPEPASLALLGLSGLALIVRRRGGRQA